MITAATAGGSTNDCFSLTLNLPTINYSGLTQNEKGTVSVSIYSTLIINRRETDGLPRVSTASTKYLHDIDAQLGKPLPGF